MSVPVKVQTAVGDGPNGGTSADVAYGLAQTAKNCNLIFVGWDTGVSAPPSLADTVSNRYLPVVSAASTVTACGFALFVCPSIKAAAAGDNLVTATFAVATNFPEIYVVELSGTDLAVPIDKLTVAFANGSTNFATAGPVTTRQANELLLGYCFNDNNASGPGAGWTLDSNSVTGYGSVLESQAVPASGTSITATTPIGSPAAWVQVVVGLQPPRPNAMFFGSP